MATSPHPSLVARPVAEIMSHPVLAVKADVMLDTVLATMVRTGLRHVAVIGDDGRCRGVVGDRAIAAAWAAAPAALDCTPVARLLDRRPSVAGADATVGDVARSMYTDGVDAVAIIDRRGRPVGMVTGGDLIALIATTREDASVPPSRRNDSTR